MVPSVLAPKTGGMELLSLSYEGHTWIWWERIKRVIFSMLGLKYPIDLQRDERC